MPRKKKVEELVNPSQLYIVCSTNRYNMFYGGDDEKKFDVSVHKDTPEYNMLLAVIELIGVKKEQDKKMDSLKEAAAVLKDME